MDLLWIVTGSSLIGAILNIYKNKYCFLIWTGTNATWAIVDYIKGIYPQSALFMVYTCLAVWGLIKWHREKKLSR